MQNILTDGRQMQIEMLNKLQEKLYKRKTWFVLKHVLLKHKR